MVHCGVVKEFIEFGNIFLGTNGFHFEKFFLACCGVHLLETAVKNILLRNEILRPLSVKSVIICGDYSKGNHAMSIFAEVLQRLQFQRFIESLKQSLE